MGTMDPRWRKQWRIERERGHLRLIDPAPVRVHVEGLLAFGMSKRSIATAAGVSPSTIVRIADGHYGLIQRRVARRVMSVRGPETVLERISEADEPFVPALGVRRRIRALIAMGWTHEHMLAHSGVRTACTLNQVGEWVTALTHRRIDAMYEALAMTPGPSETSRKRAARHGYPPPLAWDDIDDPLERPSIGLVERGIDLAEVEWLEKQGYSLGQIAYRMGVTSDAIYRRRGSAASQVSEIGTRQNGSAA